MYVMVDFIQIYFIKYIRIFTNPKQTFYIMCETCCGSAWRDKRDEDWEKLFKSSSIGWYIYI